MFHLLKIFDQSKELTIAVKTDIVPDVFILWVFFKRFVHLVMVYADTVGKSKGLETVRSLGAM